MVGQFTTRRNLNGRNLLKNRLIVAYMHAFLIWKRTFNSTVDKDIGKDVRNIKDFIKRTKISKTGKDF